MLSALVSSIHPQGWVPIETDVLAVAPSDEPAVAFTPKGGCRNRWGVRGGERRSPLLPTAFLLPQGEPMGLVPMLREGNQASLASA